MSQLSVSMVGTLIFFLLGCYGIDGNVGSLLFFLKTDNNRNGQANLVSGTIKRRLHEGFFF